MDKTIALYALSTLAQACAALAAFVGAVGLFRLQSLEHGRQVWFENISSMLGRPTMTQDEVLATAKERAAVMPVLADLLRGYSDFAPTIRRNSRWLSLFEMWNLLAILVSLLGLIYMDTFVRCIYAPAGLAVLSIGVVVVTACCVLIWFPRR